MEHDYENDSPEELEQKLKEVRKIHRFLDRRIIAAEETGHNFSKIKQWKKRKLCLRDKIVKIESILERLCHVVVTI